MDHSLEDIIAEDLMVLFCGINPGLKSAIDGHHFAGRSNRFWRTLHLSGFTPHEISAKDDRTILHYGYGLTTVVERPTSRADQLSKQEFTDSAGTFIHKIEKYKPKYIAFLGKPAYQVLSGLKEVSWGVQKKKIGEAIVWVLPNPSGLNRGFSLEQLTIRYKEMLLTIKEI
jgi:double-stranded uracil-DNA glycosylase